MNLDQKTLLLFSHFVEKNSGIFYAENELYRLQDRIDKIMRQHKIDKPHSLLSRLNDTSNPKYDQLRDDFINVSTNNETYFFRDQHIFMPFITEIIPDILNQSTGEIKMWSSACSTGQEIYSILIGLQDSNKVDISKIYIDASDISSHILEQAKSGIYNQAQLNRGLTQDQQKKYFTKIDDRKWQIDSKLKRNINFFRFNLGSDKFPMNEYDIILCRNMLIYTKDYYKQTVIEGFIQALKKKGCLLLGSSESLVNVRHSFTEMKIGQTLYYVKD